MKAELAITEYCQNHSVKGSQECSSKSFYNKVQVGPKGTKKATYKSPPLFHQGSLKCTSMALW